MTVKTVSQKISLKKLVGKGYDEFWRSKKRYVVCKGGRASKKSKTTALWMICNIMKYPLANGLVIRAYYNTLENSCFADLQWATRQLKVSHLWRFTKSPLAAIYKPTGQKIIFAGTDKPDSITSIAVPKGYINFSWWEEAFQIKDELIFDKIDQSLRGQMPEGYFIRHNIIFNPWSSQSWLKKRFFDSPDSNTLSMTTTYKDNEFLSEADIELLENIKCRDRRLYNVACLGEWGQLGDLIYNNFEIKAFNINEDRFKTYQHVVGLDWGYSIDPTAIVDVYVNEKDKEIYIDREFYKKGMLNTDIYQALQNMQLNKSIIIADCAEPKSIEELRRLGCNRIRACSKGKDSILQGIQKIQQYKVYINTNCIETYKEFNMYGWQKDKNDITIQKPMDEFNHIMDALRYAIQVVEKDKSRMVNKRKFAGL